MIVDIFCRTCDKDVKWLELSLPSWIHFFKGYRSIKIVGIENECCKIKRICDMYNVEFVPDNNSAVIQDGNINHQYSKLCADLLTDASYVLFMNSVTFCYEEIDINTHIINDKPIVQYCNWDKRFRGYVWCKPTCEFMKIDTPYNFMCNMPFIYPTSVIRDTRKYIEDVNCKKLVDLLKNVKESIGGVSEYNLLGCYAYLFCNDMFNWINIVEDNEIFTGLHDFFKFGSLNQIKEFNYVSIEERESEHGY